MRPDDLQDVVGNVVRTSEGYVFNLKEFVQFETSERFEGVEWALDTRGKLHILTGWRLTCAVWPGIVDVQQAVRLSVQGYQRASASLSSLLTLPNASAQRDKEAEDLGRLWVPNAVGVHVVMTERPVEGAGLRIHLRGFVMQLMA